LYTVIHSFYNISLTLILSKLRNLQKKVSWVEDACRYLDLILAVSDVLHSKRTTGPRCAKSCRGRRRGKYQSCTSCRKYMVCRSQRLHKMTRCHGRRVWDDVRKRCRSSSSTCVPVKGENHSGNGGRVIHGRVRYGSDSVILYWA